MPLLLVFALLMPTPLDGQVRCGQLAKVGARKPGKTGELEVSTVENCSRNKGDEKNSRRVPDGALTVAVPLIAEDSPRSGC